MEHLGSYEIEAELGRGGFGRVYRAHDPRIGRRVAIKLLTTETDPELIARFRREASLTANLRHENIVTVHEYGDHEGRPYLVMEFLEGETLAAAMDANRPFNLLDKLRILCEIARGLAYAHQRGVIHRDIKPGNIMILPDGSVKMLDFGIARAATSESSRRTREGFLLGTPLYMAPEQLQDATDADPLTDLFAFGAVSYEFLAGGHPFRANDPGAIMYKILYEEPAPLHERAPECPEALERVVARALAKDRDLRYQSLDDLRLDLEAVYARQRRERAVSILDEIRPLLGRDDLPDVQARLKVVLELDPTNAEAREAREKSQKRAARARVSTLVAEAREHLRERRYREAVQILEAAARSDREDTAITALLDEAKTAQDRANRSSRLLAESRLRADRGELDAALRNISESLSLDSANSSGIRWKAELESRIAERNQKRVDAALEKADALLRSHRYDEARSALSTPEIQTLGDARIAALAERIGAQEAEQARQERSRRFSGVCAQIGKAIDAGEWAAARRFIASAERDFAEPAETATIAALARRATDLETETSIRESVARIDDLIRAKRFDEAERSAQVAVAAFDKAPALKDALDRARAERTRHEREKKQSAAWDEIGALRTAGNVAGALERTRAAERQFPEYDRFAELAQQLEEEHARALYDTGLREALVSGRSLLASGRLVEALAHLDSAAFRYPDAREIAELLDKAKRAHAVEQAESEARALLREGRADAALPVLHGALQRQPSADGLRTLLCEVEQQIALEARRRAVSSILAEVFVLVTTGQHERAVRELEIGLETYPGESALEKELERVSAIATEHTLQRPGATAAELGDRVRVCLEEGDLGQAGELLASAPAELRDVHPLPLLRVRYDAERSLREELRGAAALIAQRKLDQARARIDALRNARPWLREIADLERLFEEAKSASTKEHDRRMAWVIAGVAAVVIFVIVFAVRYLRGQAGALQIGSKSIEWFYDQNRPAPLETAIEVNSSSPVEFRIRSDARWLTVAPVSAQTPAKIIARAVADAIPPGRHTATLAFQAGGKTTVVPVSLDVIGKTAPGDKPSAAGPPAIGPHAAQLPESKLPAMLTLDLPAKPLEFESPIGSAQQTNTAHIGASKAVPFQAQYEPQGAWLAVSPEQGRTPVDLRVTINPIGLAPGTHTGTLTLVAGEKQEARGSINIVLRVLDPPLPPKRPVLTLREYRGRMKGELRWGGSLANSEIAVIQGGKSAPGTITGDFPNVAISVTISPPEVTLVETPSEHNNWDRIVVRNQTGGPISGFTVEWTVAR